MKTKLISYLPISIYNIFMIKLVATDIDGTIIIPEKTFTPEVKDCIKRLSDSGIKVVLVTGRMHAAASLIAEDLALTTPGPILPRRLRVITISFMRSQAFLIREKITGSLMRIT